MAATSNPQRKENNSSSNIINKGIFDFLQVSPRIVVENASVDNPTQNNTDPNKLSPTFTRRGWKPIPLLMHILVVMCNDLRR